MSDGDEPQSDMKRIGEQNLRKTNSPQHQLFDSPALGRFSILDLMVATALVALHMAATYGVICYTAVHAHSEDVRKISTMDDPDAV